MPKAEVGSTKYLSNQMRRKGLQRLRWYCQVCERQMPDQNGFKLHTQSESHVRQMLIVGEDPKKHINNFSNEFQRDFIQLLKTGHGEKQVHMNKFYQEYIANKEHIHMNSTKWPSLTEFAKHLGREGICRVEENDKGLHIAWIDDSPEALRRRDAVRRKEAMEQGDEQSEQRMIQEQIRRAQANAGRKPETEEDPEVRELKRQEGEKIKLSFGAKPAAGSKAPAQPGEEPQANTSTEEASKEAEKPHEAEKAPAAKSGGFGGVSMKIGAKPPAKNVFAQAKKNALSGGSKKSKVEQPKKMSEAERIMKEEMEKKRSRESAGFSMPGSKKQRNA